MPVREVFLPWACRRAPCARQVQGQEATVQQADMSGLQAKAQMLELPVLDQRQVLLGREDACQEGALLSRYQGTGALRYLEGRQDLVEEAPAEMISSVWCGGIKRGRGK